MVEGVAKLNVHKQHSKRSLSKLISQSRTWLSRAFFNEAPISSPDTKRAKVDITVGQHLKSASVRVFAEDLPHAQQPPDGLLRVGVNGFNVNPMNFSAALRTLLETGSCRGDYFVHPKQDYLHFSTHLLIRPCKYQTTGTSDNSCSSRQDYAHLVIL